MAANGGAEAGGAAAPPGWGPGAPEGLPPPGPTAAAQIFARSQGNRALDTVRTADGAAMILRAMGLPLHPDHQKDWDTLIAVGAAAEAAAGGIVLDAGGGKESAFLPGAALLGVPNLLALNTEFRYTEWSGGVEYRPGDATRTGLPSGSVDVFACLSVVEHGVDAAALAAEAARVTRPGGLAVVSTDYWDGPVDARGQVAFGAPVRVFDAEGVRAMADEFLGRGFALHGGPLRTECADRTVQWLGMEYTFFNLLLRRL